MYRFPWESVSQKMEDKVKIQNQKMETIMERDWSDKQWISKQLIKVRTKSTFQREKN